MKKYLSAVMIIVCILCTTGCVREYAFTESEVSAIDRNATEMILGLSFEDTDWSFDTDGYYGQSDNGLRIVHRVREEWEEYYRDGKNYIYRDKTLRRIGATNFFTDAQSFAGEILEKIKICFERRLFESVSSCQYMDIVHRVVYELNEEGRALFQDDSERYSLMYIYVYAHNDLSFETFDLCLKYGDEPGEWDVFSFGNDRTLTFYNPPWE